MGWPSVRLYHFTKRIVRFDFLGGVEILVTALHFSFSFSFKSYLKLVFTIVDDKILIHTNYLQERYTLYKRKNHYRHILQVHLSPAQSLILFLKAASVG